MTATPATATDPYVPERGNAGYDVTGYDLDLDYRDRLEPPRRAGPGSRPRPPSDAATASPSTSSGSASTKVARRRSAGPLAAATAASSTSRRPTPIDAGAAVRRRRPLRRQPPPDAARRGARSGWEELADGVLVASQPSGAPTWFPCNDLARPEGAVPRRGHGGVRRTTSSPTARSCRRGCGGSRTTWVYEQAEPMSPYLATLHIGRYDEHRRSPTGRSPIRAVLPPRHRRAVRRGLRAGRPR